MSPDIALEVDCACGERLAVAAALAGLTVRCKACGASVPVPRADGTLPPRPAPRPAAVPPPPPPPTAPPKPKTLPPAPTGTDLKRSSGVHDPQAVAAAPDEQSQEGWFNGGVIGGLGLVLLSVVWLGVGLALDRLFFYPIILFFIGVGTIIKGGITNR